jgi:hypothetical protein
MDGRTAKCQEISDERFQMREGWRSRRLPSPALRHHPRAPIDRLPPVPRSRRHVALNALLQTGCPCTAGASALSIGRLNKKQSADNSSSSSTEDKESHSILPLKTLNGTLGENPQSRIERKHQAGIDRAVGSLISERIKDATARVHRGAWRRGGIACGGAGAVGRPCAATFQRRA